MPVPANDNLRSSRLRAVLASLLVVAAAVRLQLLMIGI